LPHEGVNQQLIGLLRCVECDTAWFPDDASRWRAYLTGDEPREVLVYCEQCAAREFDSPPA
jgi:hypothetical protein